MAGLNPAIHQEKACQYCGADAADREAAENTSEYGDCVEMAIPLCGGVCTRAYLELQHDDIEGFEEICRAGAT
jgi:hypothetical protein